MVLFLTACLNSCSKDDDFLNPDKPMSENVTKILDNTCTEWGSTKNLVMKQMKGFRLIENKDTTVLQFQTKNLPVTVIYQFADDRLCATLIKAKTDEKEMNISEIIKDFTYIGESGGKDIYIEKNKNIFAATYNLNEENENEEDESFQIIGFTPLFAITESSENREYVDLGLSVKWAYYNIGASKPEEFGGYFAWGETAEKNSYTWPTYQFCDGTYKTCRNLGDSICGTKYDVASVEWGGNWQIPMKKHVDELIKNCNWVWTSVNGVNGYKVFGNNGNYIFLPAAGYKYTSLNNADSRGVYMTSSPYSKNEYAYSLNFIKSTKSTEHTDRCFGLSIRPVIK